MMWAAIVGGSLGCYVLKLTGLSLPARAIDHPRVRRVAELLPVAVLAALIATATVTEARSLTVDARLAGLAVAAIAVWRRAPFLVVVTVASRDDGPRPARLMSLVGTRREYRLVLASRENGWRGRA